jgi:hypothetical protein
LNGFPRREAKQQCTDEGHEDTNLGGRAEQQ